MDVESRLDALLALAEQLGIEIRREHLGGEGGGYCLLRGKGVIFVDLAADARTRYDHTLAAMAHVPELGSRYLPPAVREDLDRLCAEDDPE